MAGQDTRDWKKTACNICYANCGVDVLLGEDGRTIEKVRGDKDHPASQGYTCNKAARIGYYQNGRDRLTTPLRRKADGTYEEVDWDTAIREVNERLSAIRDEHGGDKIMYYGGGNQGGHLAGASSTSLFAAYGIKYRSSALAQEKTGLFWVNGRLYGTLSHSELEHAQTLLIVGKNPWQSNGIQRARIILKEASKDPNRTLIVIDPRRTESAALADIHLKVRPGRDAWLLAAIGATIIQEGWAKTDWIAEHTTGFDKIQAAFEQVPVDDYAEFCGVPKEQIVAAAKAIAQSESMSSYEDLGIEMAPHSTLCSYLHLLLTPLTGNYAKEGGTVRLTSLVDLTSTLHFLGTLDENGYEQGYKTSPVTGSRIVSDLMPCNVLPEEILTDHPNRFRAMIIETTNPVHSLADSQKMREALRALEFSVCIDVALTETALESDYVLPTPSHYEKSEATFFNFSSPGNVFHLRKPLMDPLEGTLDEMEIHARLVEASGAFDRPELIEQLRGAADLGLDAYAMAFFGASAEEPAIMKYVAYLCYRTLGPTLPKGSERAALVWGLCLRYVMEHANHAAAAGFDEGNPMATANKLFQTILDTDTGVVFGVEAPEDAFERCPHPDKKIPLVIQELLDELGTLNTLEDLVDTSDEFPLVLAAGERRAYTANTNIRNPEWMKSPDVWSLSIHPEDAAPLGLEDGDAAKLETERGSAQVTIACTDEMHRGTISIPNGLGLSYPKDDGSKEITGVAPNELTASGHRDRFVGTPLHKHVPARLVKV